MSKVWSQATGWVDDGKGKPATPTPAPVADSQEEMAKMGTETRNENLERRLPTSWIHANYGVPSEGDGDKIRSKLCHMLKAHGLQTTDSKRLKSRGGSSYVGPSDAKMDAELDKLVKELEKKFNAADLVTIYHGTYDQATAAMFADRTTKNALNDLADAERSLTQLERAISGQEKMLNSKGKELDPLTTGRGRIASARRAVDEVDTVLARFAGNPGLEQEAERVRTRAAQIRAWTETVAKGFERYAQVEEARRKKSGNGVMVV